MNTSYTTDEPSAALWLEQSTYAGNTLASIIYGVHLAIGLTTLYQIYDQRKRRNPWWNALFVVSLIGTGTVMCAMGLYFGQKAWIDNRDYPGGPLGYIMNMQAQPIDTAGSAASTITCLIGDGLLIWRSYIMWGSRWYIVVIPVLQWIVVAVLGGLLTKAQSIPDATLFSSLSVQIGVPYFALEMTLNILCTILILVPLLIARRNATVMLGSSHARMYTSVAAIMIESALPNAIVSLIFLVLYVMNNTAENLFIMPLLQIQCIAPEMIVLRVVSGQAWNQSTHRELSTAATRAQLYELNASGTKVESTTRVGGGSQNIVFKSLDYNTAHDIKVDTTTETTRDASESI